MTAPQERSALRTERERTIERLCDAFAEDLFDEDELERRMDEAHRAPSLDALAVLTADLPAARVVGSPSVSIAIATVARQVPAVRRPRQNVVAIFGATGRTGSWTPAGVVRATSLFGNVRLDFREALLPAGKTHVRAISLFGSIEIVVPPGLAVEVEGVGIFGQFDHMDRTPAFEDADAPRLRVTGAAMFGQVEVNTKLPGEDDWQAWKRRRRELRGLPPGRP
jgi:hypothetical protein